MGAFLLPLAKEPCSPANSRIMIHQPLGGFQGAGLGHRDPRAEILPCVPSLNMLAKRGQSVRQIERDTRTGISCPRKTPCATVSLTRSLSRSDNGLITCRRAISNRERAVMADKKTGESSCIYRSALEIAAGPQSSSRARPCSSTTECIELVQRHHSADEITAGTRRRQRGVRVNCLRRRNQRHPRSVRDWSVAASCRWRCITITSVCAI